MIISSKSKSQVGSTDKNISVVDREILDSWWKSKAISVADILQKHAHVLDLLDSASYPLIDLGCGTGKFLQCVEAIGADHVVIGVEGSEYAVKNKVCRSNILCDDIRHWVPGGNVATVTLIDVIEHINNPQKLLERIAGYADNIIIACPNFNHFTARLSVLFGRVPFQNRPQRGGHVYWCNYHMLFDLFESIGFAVIKEHHLYSKHNIQLARWIGKLAPSFFAHEFVFHIRRNI